MICEFWSVLDLADTLGAATLDFSGKITRCNRAFARLVGRGAEDVVNVSVYDITAEQDRELTRKKLAALTQGEADATYHVKRYVRPNGVPVWCQTEKLVVKSSESNERLCLIVLVWPLADGTAVADAEQDLRVHRLILQELQNQQSTNQSWGNIGRVPGVMVNVNRDVSNQIADRGGKITTVTNQGYVVVILVALLTLAAIATIALSVGGYFSVKQGDTQVEVQGKK